MSCQIVIEGLQSTAPFINGDEPASVTIAARSGGNCTQARVSLLAAGPGTPVIGTQVVTVASDPSAPPPLTGLITASIVLPRVGLLCGDRLYIKVECTQGDACAAEGFFGIVCKPAPAGGTPGGGVGPRWPNFRCIFAAAGAAMMLLAALNLIAYGISLQNALSIGAGITLLGPVGIAWALWVQWCGPGICVRQGVLCWVFKRAFLMAIPALPLSSNMVIVLVLIAYGSVAGILAQKLRERHCLVPSARLPLTQLPL